MILHSIEQRKPIALTTAFYTIEYTVTQTENYFISPILSDVISSEFLPTLVK